MIGRRIRCAYAAAGLAVLVACAGEGTGLDEFGLPLRRAAAPLSGTLSTIQAQIFTPICVPCHTGGSAPLGLALDGSTSRSNLVGVTSVEMPSLMRVKPGQPDSSYLVWKLEGRAGIAGGRMPLGGPPLSKEQVAAIRRWIAEGAASN